MKMEYLEKRIKISLIAGGTVGKDHEEWIGPDFRILISMFVEATVADAHCGQRVLGIRQDFASRDLRDLNGNWPADGARQSRLIEIARPMLLCDIESVARAIFAPLVGDEAITEALAKCQQEIKCFLLDPRRENPPPEPDDLISRTFGQQ